MEKLRVGYGPTSETNVYLAPWSQTLVHTYFERCNVRAKIRADRQGALSRPNHATGYDRESPSSALVEFEFVSQSESGLVLSFTLGRQHRRINLLKVPFPWDGRGRDGSRHFGRLMGTYVLIDRESTD